MNEDQQPAPTPVAVQQLPRLRSQSQFFSPFSRTSENPTATSVIGLSTSRHTTSASAETKCHIHSLTLTRSPFYAATLVMNDFEASLRPLHMTIRTTSHTTSSKDKSSDTSADLRPFSRQDRFLYCRQEAGESYDDFVLMAKDEPIDLTRIPILFLRRSGIERNRWCLRQLTGGASFLRKTSSKPRSGRAMSQLQ